HVPAQVTRERCDLLREARVAGDLDRAQELLLAARQREQRAWAGLQREVRRFATRPDAPVVENRYAQRGKRQWRELDRLAGEAREALARPRLGGEQSIDEKAKGHRRGGLFAGQGVL